MPSSVAISRRPRPCSVAPTRQGATTWRCCHFLGYLARSRNDLTDAGNFYAAALARNPTDAELHNNLAEVRRAQQRDAEAIALYRRAIALSPDKAEIHGNLGSLLMALRRPDEALSHLQQALELRPDLTPLRNDIALALSALGRYPEVAAHYRAEIRRTPRQCRSAVSRGTGAAGNRRFRTRLAAARSPMVRRTRPDQAAGIRRTLVARRG